MPKTRNIDPLGYVSYYSQKPNSQKKEMLWDYN